MRKHLLDIPIDWLTLNELDDTLTHFLHSGKSHHITTVNPEFIVLAERNVKFKRILEKSNLSLPDGTGIVLGQTFLDSKQPRSHFRRWIAFIRLGVRYLFTPGSFSYKRITGVELTHNLLLKSAQAKYKIFLLGAAPGVAEQAAAIWQKRYDGVQIVGTSGADPDSETIVEEIKQAAPDILLVAYGAPKQEFFIAEHKDELKIPIMVGVGGTFDYAVGTIRPAPCFIRAIGLEWVARLIQQPKRIKRIFNSTIGFINLLTQIHE